MPNQVHAVPQPSTRMQVESWSEGNRLSVVGQGDRLTTAGAAAILSALGTYWTGLTAAQQAALTPAVTMTPYRVDAAVLGGDLPTVAATITAAIRTPGNTTKNS